MCMLFVVLPVWIGFLWVWFLDVKGTFMRLCNAWMLGLVTMFAAGQIILVPMILTGKTLTYTIGLWKIILTVLCVLTLILLLKKQEDGGNTRREETQRQKVGIWGTVFTVLAVVLILIQAWIPFHYQHIDDDDARYVSEEVSAVVHDTLLVDDPITDEYMYWDVGEVRKD